MKESDQIDAWRTTLGVQTGGDFGVTDEQRHRAGLTAVEQESRGLQDRAATIAILQMSSPPSQAPTPTTSAASAPTRNRRAIPQPG